MQPDNRYSPEDPEEKKLNKMTEELSEVLNKLAHYEMRQFEFYPENELFPPERGYNGRASNPRVK